MSSKISAHRLVFVVVLAITSHAQAASCVWKVSGPNRATLYLGGSIHALHSTDYPLPPAYNRAFDAATHLAFEVDRKAMSGSGKDILKKGQYPRGDSLKNHVDPRTYDYLRRVFGLMKVPEKEFSKFRAWFLVVLLQSPSLHGLSEELGVEEFLMRRATANSKPVIALESLREHMEVFSGLTDRQSEAILLLTFIPTAPGTADRARMMEAWRHGDPEFLARQVHESFRDYPAFGERLLGARNRAWIPKIERYLRSGKTYLVVVGVAHMGGRDGVLTLLKARGYQIEQP